MRRGTAAGRRANFSKMADGLLPTVVQEAEGGRVLGVAYSSRASLAKLRRTGELYLYSRSRRELWRKGATSGNTARVVEVALDCDGDALLVRVVMAGPYCHTGRSSCFEGSSEPHERARGDVIADLEAVIRDRREHPQPGSYTNELLEDEERRLKKVGEEATEFVVAAARGDRAAALRESADLVYHLLVVCASLGIPWTEVEATLAGRRGAARRRPAERPARAPTPPSGGSATRRAPRTRR
jgi:phosphoribosyl-ATP pyrophosphohydrolase/phosphoribosyl-AMP cyclohydrolase